MASEKLPRAFVLMPFGPPYDDVYHEVLCTALAGFEVARADSRLDERGILEKIVTGIDEADLIVADLSESNPNVMYELGVAHSLGKPTVMISRSIPALPFDIRAYPVHEYSTDAGRRTSLAAHLGELAQRHRDGLVLFANPVADFLPRVGALLAAARETDPGIAKMVEDYAADINWAGAQIEQYFTQFDAVTTRHTERLNAAIARVRQGYGQGSDSGVHQAAVATRDFALELRELSDMFRNIWKRFGTAMLWLTAPEQRVHLGNARATKFAQNARSSSQHLDDMLSELAELRHVNRTFTRVSGDFAHALDTADDAITQMLNEIMTAKAYLLRIVQSCERTSA